MAFELIHGDLTTMKTDAIVNAANSALQMGGGVCGAIFRAAGARDLQQACDQIGGCETGQAVITHGFGLPVRYIIHTVGPVWHGGISGEAALLEACYRNSVQLAVERKLRSIAFPLISSGIYGYPREEALEIAQKTIAALLKEQDIDVYLVLFE